MIMSPEVKQWIIARFEQIYKREINAKQAEMLLEQFLKLLEKKQCV